MHSDGSAYLRSDGDVSLELARKLHIDTQGLGYPLDHEASEALGRPALVELKSLPRPLGASGYTQRLQIHK